MNRQHSTRSPSDLWIWWLLSCLQTFLVAGKRAQSPVLNFQHPPQPGYDHCSPWTVWSGKQIRQKSRRDLGWKWMSGSTRSTSALSRLLRRGRNKLQKQQKKKEKRKPKNPKAKQRSLELFMLLSDLLPRTQDKEWEDWLWFPPLHLWYKALSYGLLCLYDTDNDAIFKHSGFYNVCSATWYCLKVWLFPILLH